MAIKKYYYIDGNGNPCELTTGDLDYQATAEAHILAEGLPKGNPVKSLTAGTKHVLVEGNVVEQSQDYVTVEEPFDIPS